ncbi:lipid-a-disaccharide synthase [hydrocarbon metagenome]|uniref:lipid-A-disaccharide synthase n=1 Tax=hydrocarbon metagenome TaxID=938273 RepID=A0A0W8FRW0_9ZZZZ
MPLEEKKSNPLMPATYKKNKTIMIVAGEASGDMHGANLVKEMLKIDPTLNFYGIGGKKMKEEKVQLLADASGMAVVGLTEVFSKLGNIFKIMSIMKKSMDERKPDLVILIDYPDFNLPLATAAKKRGIKVFYYISPQVWAWRKGRIEQIKKNVNKMAVILPFEVETYAQAGFTVNYVGHPLLDLVKQNYSKQESRKKFGLAENKTTIGILPGSRLSETEKLMPELLLAAEILKRELPDIQFVLPLADTLEEKNVAEIISRFDLKINIITGHTYDVISCADLALVASGTATLETALLNVPMVIVYKISLLSYIIGRLIVDVKNIGLVNIIAGKTIVPELIQKDASGQRIAEEALSILNNVERKQEIIKEMSEIRAKLGEPGAAIRAAQIACDMI